MPTGGAEADLAEDLDEAWLGANLAEAWLGADLAVRLIRWHQRYGPRELRFRGPLGGGGGGGFLHRSRSLSCPRLAANKSVGTLGQTAEWAVKLKAVQVAAVSIGMEPVLAVHMCRQ